MGGCNHCLCQNILLPGFYLQIYAGAKDCKGSKTKKSSLKLAFENTWTTFVTIFWIFIDSGIHK